MSHGRRVVEPIVGRRDRTVIEPGAAGVVTSGDGDVVVLEVTGTLPEAVVAANDAVLRALCVGPRVIVCDLSGTTGALGKTAREQLLDTGGHLEHWPGTRLVLVHPDDRIHELSDAPAARHARVHLDHHPRASRAARDFVARTCLDWHQPQVIGSAVLVVSELVTNGLTHAGTALDVTLSCVDNRLRLAVHDGAVASPRVLVAGGRHGRGLQVVDHLARAWGSLPHPQGGKEVWAVLDT